jgi:hypothetical protein
VTETDAIHAIGFGRQRTISRSFRRTAHGNFAGSIAEKRIVRDRRESQCPGMFAQRSGTTRRFKSGKARQAMASSRNSEENLIMAAWRSRFERFNALSRQSTDAAERA